MNPLVQTIVSTNPHERNRAFEDLCSGYMPAEILAMLPELDVLRKETTNLYERVRACLFLFAAYRFVLQEAPAYSRCGSIPPAGHANLLNRNYEKAIRIFLQTMAERGPDATLFSCLAESYQQLGFKILADQVRKSVRSSRGNQWMFRLGHADQHPLRVRPELLRRTGEQGLYPLLREETPVRLDLSHSAWSDIFFLGMDNPEGARVINISVDLGVYGRDPSIASPLICYLRVINEPMISLSSLDLKDTKDIRLLDDLFNFGADYLGLLKAAVIASGLIPPSFEGTSHSLQDILRQMLGPGLGLELVTRVNDIPKGSRLAVSTNLLASMISLIMRATGQTSSLTGELTETERRLVASRAILGEWLGGSGGGWQDSGGIWRGIKSIEGVLTKEGDAEFGISRGCLLPRHREWTSEDLHPAFQEKLCSSLVLMHGGMASNVGPVLEMVTARYLLRSRKEWEARLTANALYDEVKALLETGDIEKLADCTNRNFFGPLKTIIPWASNHYTETIIRKAIEKLGKDYLGFLMLGGISGGGMGMFVNPVRQQEAREKILEILRTTAAAMKHALPFAMEPLVYNFNINQRGSFGSLLSGADALLPSAYYALHIPRLAQEGKAGIPELRRVELDLFTSACGNNNEAFPILRSLVGNLFPYQAGSGGSAMALEDRLAETIKKDNGFDYTQHEQIRQDLLMGRIGLARNRLPAQTSIEDVKESDVTFLEDYTGEQPAAKALIRTGGLAVVCLAAGIGSRWTQGAGVIKAIHPFVEIGGKHRDFLELHLAKHQKTAEEYAIALPVVIATSYLTQGPLEATLLDKKNYHYSGNVMLSEGRSIGQRFVPMERDLRFLWEVMPQERLDENKQKVRESVREALIKWAVRSGEGSDYTGNLAHQRLSPLGHWYEIPNLLRNGILIRLLKESPNLKHLLLHNIDTLGATVSEDALAAHLNSGNAITFEVVPRRVDDHGGGLASINGKIRLLEGLAQPDEEDELKLSYYNTLTSWIDIDQLLELFGFSRETLAAASGEEISGAIRTVARRLPSYVTIKDVKYRWGHGQEDIYPVAQIEKLWGDMASLPELPCGFVVVPRQRGRQLKEISQLDGWVKDGGKEYIENLCKFPVP